MDCSIRYIIKINYINRRIGEWVIRLKSSEIAIFPYKQPITTIFSNNRIVSNKWVDSTTSRVQ